ncbi:hypothetical protein JTE90_028094 [Oedothorax gibbosus]|uniref:Glutaredoxin n=1 Tax=Oedothorax gibbosus TaxID=931172 RepID=A0AAV6V8M3_9ARAC|nr:hypothetical protein JTE90_028094 [Oedothorax gibbosus]
MASAPLVQPKQTKILIIRNEFTCDFCTVGTKSTKAMVKENRQLFPSLRTKRQAISGQFLVDGSLRTFDAKVGQLGQNWDCFPNVLELPFG